MSTELTFSRLIIERLCDDLPMPSYATPGSSGLDLYANIEDPIVLRPLQRVLVPTGIKVQLPYLTELQIRPRSGLALKKGLHVHFGTVDSDFRGEIGAILFNLSHEYITISRGDKIAQAVLCPILRYPLSEAKVDTTARGEGGFGSTGF